MRARRLRTTIPCRTRWRWSARLAPDGFHYQLYFNEPDRPEADLDHDPRNWLKGFFFTASADAPPEEVTMGARKRGDALHDAFAEPRHCPRG